VSDTPTDLASRADEMRQAFDRTFAEAARRDMTPMENLLAFSLGAEHWALRLSEIAGLFVDREIIPVPGGANTLRGVAGFRGLVLPVYDLHALLGHPASEAPRWLAIASDAPAAFAFETFAGHLRIPRDTITPRALDTRSQRFVQDFASEEGLVRPVVHLRSVLDAIREQLPTATRGEER
jgi:chemotaxis signal transduction protein